MAKINIGWQHPTDESDQWDGFNESGIEHFKGSPIKHLAREVIQNALDAATTDIVVVKMKIQNVNTNTIPNIKKLKENLMLCQKASKNESDKAEIFFDIAIKELKKPKIQVLEISDHNTKGMAGPCENGTPFYAYMKAKGQSRKDSVTASGSYGIGKFAPYAVSKIRTMFVSTVYKDSDEQYNQLTQGKSILMSHDKNHTRKQGVGFWGVNRKCQPVKGVNSNLPEWILRTNDDSGLPEFVGTKLSVLCFDATKNWEEHLTVSVAENFFGAINDGKLSVEINDNYIFDKENISNFFEDNEIKEIIQDLKDEPETFENCKNYLETLSNNIEVFNEEHENRVLGLCRLKILVGEGLPKKVCMLRNGMFITDSLDGLKIFSDFKEFVAVIECKSEKGNELLRNMEPPRHDTFEPDRLATAKDQKLGRRALRELAKWVREMLKRHAKEPVSNITEIDELRDFLGEEGSDSEGKGVDEINPYGEIRIQARPIKYHTSQSQSGQEGDSLGDDEDGEGGGGSSGAGGGDGRGGTGGGAGKKAEVGLSNVRAILTNARARKVAFTPTSSNRVALQFFEAGADNDFKVSVVKSDKGTIKNGNLILEVNAAKRHIVNLELEQEFIGALKVVANEV